MYERWLGMEQFYYNDMWYFVIASCVLLFLFFPSIKYYKKKITWVIFALTFITVSASYVFIRDGYEKYGDLIELTSYTNPSNRHYEKKLFNDFPYSRSEYTQYRIAYMKPYFEQIQLYEPEALEEDVEYLGTDGTYYYVSFGPNQDYYFGDRFVEFTDEVDSPVRQGVRFHLEDSQFEKIGFIPTSTNFFVNYVIPEEIKDREVDRDRRMGAAYQTSNEMISGWISP